MSSHEITERFISEELHNRLVYLGIIDPSHVRDTNVGNSNYAKHLIQPWTVALDWDLDPWEMDIIKRTLRTKVDAGYSEIEQRILDMEKIQHDCAEKIRQLSWQKDHQD